MCEISRAIYQDGYSDGISVGEKRGEKRGIDIGRKELVSEFIRNNKISVSEGAVALKMSESELIRELKRPQKV